MFYVSDLVTYTPLSCPTVVNCTVSFAGDVHSLAGASCLLGVLCVVAFHWSQLGHPQSHPQVSAAVTCLAARSDIHTPIGGDPCVLLLPSGGFLGVHLYFSEKDKDRGGGGRVVLEYLVQVLAVLAG